MKQGLQGLRTEEDRLIQAFKVGDKAVYPAHGVAEIESVETKEISGRKTTFYVLKILESGMKIMLPTANVGAVGLREVISKDEVEEIYDILRERDVRLDHQTWNRRYREYMDKIKTGSAHEIAEVMRDLYLLKSDKELSFSERKMLETARSLLVKELSIAERRKEADVEQKLNAIFTAH